MVRLALTSDDFKRLVRHRRRCGADRYDEVWNGVYVMSPLADNEHQMLGFKLASALDQALADRGDVKVFPGINVSDRAERWRKNYRCPDVAVFLPGNPAEDRMTHWLGGPDFAVEVVSRGDRSRAKLDFYAGVGVRELLVIDRHPWRLELYRVRSGRMEPVGVSEPGTADVLMSQVLPVSLRLVVATPRPRVELTRTEDGRVWTV